MEQHNSDFPFPVLQLDFGRVEAFLLQCSRGGVGYRLGAKVPRYGATPGVDFKRIDCSGFVREALRLAIANSQAIPGGSVVQHSWVKSRRFKESSVESAKLHDNVVRIAFLRPQDSNSGIGHVALVRNGSTYESHATNGPDRRAWTGKGWQAKALVYVLTKPES